MHKQTFLTMALMAVLMTSGGCAYRYYLGMHGPSIRNSPEIHTASIREDRQCLACHSPESNADGAPVTTHPTFTGCIKCHDGIIK